MATRARRRSSPLTRVWCVGLLILVAACSGADDATPEGSSPTTEPADPSGTAIASSRSAATPVVLDYSPTISDIGALFYLASHPDVELLAVTLPERGESDCEGGTRHTRSLLMIADRPDVPVGCGVEVPLVGDRDWPQPFRDFADALAGVVLPGVPTEPPVDGAVLLADTLRAAERPVTIVAVGPLTNLGVVLRDWPELVANIERVVIMGGAVDVAGNVEAAPTAEWNLYIDPEAARQVLASGVDVLLVPLDATNDVPWTDVLVAELGLLDSPVGISERQVVASRGFTDGIFLWDELAAVATMHPEMLQIERRTIVVDDDGATLEDPSGVAVDVAVGADAGAVTREFLRVLNGGTLPDTPAATPEERVYLDVVAAGFSEFDAALEAFVPDVGADSHAEADRFIAATFRALRSLETEIVGVDPPGSVAADHDQLELALGNLSAQENDLRATIAATEGDDFWTLLEAGALETDFEDGLNDVFVACTSIADYLLLRAGPLSCQGFGR